MNAQTKVEATTLASAMALAFAEIEAATKTADNPAFKQGGKAIKYADLGSVIDAIKPALINHGLFFTQHPRPSDDGVCVETVLHHAGGEHLSLGQLYVPANKKDAQGFGSALTYARRYGLMTAFGVPAEDDDGNAAAKSTNASAPPAPTGKIDDGQYATLTTLIEKYGADTKRFLKYWNIETVNDLLAKDFAEAVSSLNEYWRVKQARQNGAAAQPEQVPA